MGRPRNPQWVGADWHGTINGYSYHGCRDECCVKANAEHQRQMNRNRAKRPIPEHVHGTPAGRTNYNCVCDRCMEAYLAKQAEYRERRKQRAM